MRKILKLYKNGNKGFSVLIEPNNLWPLLYYRKPKHMTVEQFLIIIEGMEVSISREALEKLQLTEGGFGSTDE